MEDQFVSRLQSPVAMAAEWPDFHEKDLNRAKNIKACDEVIPFVFETVIAWGCPKNKDESFLAYYNRRPEKLGEDNKGEWEKEVEEKLKTRDMTNWSESRKKDEKEKITRRLKKEKKNKLLIKVAWTQEEEKYLKQKTCDGFDVTLLNKLVPTICDGIGRYDSNAPSSTQIEQYLREVKNIRNDICHDPKGASISGTMLDELEVSAVNVLNAAGVLYAQALDQQTVRDKIDELIKRLRKIKTEVMTDNQQRILQTAKKMSEDGMAEMHAAVKRQDTDFLPLSDDKVTRMDVFYSVNLLIKNSKNMTTNHEIPSHELLEHFKGSNVLCEGLPGTGKTTLLKSLREDFGAKSKERFRGVRKFDLLMYMECRNNSVTTVEQLLERQFPKTCCQLMKEEVITALRKLKLLICVDGLDELTSLTKKLFRELISIFEHSGNATFIFTSRPGQAQSVSLNYETVTLQPLKKDQQEEFLRLYQANIKGFKGPALIESFKSLNETCKAFLVHPVYLAMFCALFRKSPEVVKKWKNEVTLLNDVLRLSERTMINRMASMCLINSGCYAYAVTTTILDLSVCLLLRDEMTLTAKTYIIMCRNIFGDAEVEYFPIMSTFFTRHPDQQTFEFSFISYYEFFAAKAIAQRFVSSPAAGVVRIIQSIYSELSHYFQDGAVPVPAVSFKRFANVLRFVCMLLHEGGRPVEGALQLFLQEVCPALVREEVGLDYWTDFVLGCLDSDQVAQAAAEAAECTWPGGNLTVQSSRAMIAASKMLPHRQPTFLRIEPRRGQEDQAALAVLLHAVSRWHTGNLSINLSESHDNYSPCDASFACLESARCKLYYFKGCLSGGSSRLWHVLIGGAKWVGDAHLELSISLLDPMRHDMDQLDGTSHALNITARPPSSPGCRRRRPLPTGTLRPPSLRVNCRPAAGGQAPADEGEITALIVDLAPRDMLYCHLFLLHYPGSDRALDEMVATLRASGVRTNDSNTWGWKEAESSKSIHDCVACGDSSSHRPGERCVSLHS